MKAIGKLKIKALRSKDDDITVRVFAREGGLVLHEPIYVAQKRAKGEKTRITRDDEYVIAHEASTFSIARLTLDKAERALVALAKLDWSVIPSEVEEVIRTVKADHPLGKEVNAILAEIR